MTWNDVRNEPALPQLTVIGHLPSVVFPPTIQVQEIRPPPPGAGLLGSSPWACDGPLL